MNILTAAAIGFFVTVLAVLALRPLAITIDLIDRPGGHKTHHGNVPLVGGLAMFLGLVAGLGMLDPQVPAGTSLVGVAAILVVIGLLDDRFALSHWPRLAVHLSAAIALIVGTGTVVTHLGNSFGFGDVALHGFASTLFTVVLIAAAINAFNMLDGMDGLAGITAVNALVAIALVGLLRGGSSQETAICAVVGGSVSAFLLFNVPARYVGEMRCFMGDAGSTLLGAVVAWLCIRVNQGSATTAVHPVTVLWFVGLPLCELFWTVLRRLLRGRSPMRADREHLHHLLIGAGFSVRAAFMVFGMINLLLAAMGFVLQALDIPEYISLALFVAVAAGLVRLMYRPQFLLAMLPEGRRGSHQGQESALR